MTFDQNHHTFVVCAYKESVFLEECIDSLMAQTVRSNIIIATSTPCEFIENVAQKYRLPLLVNPVQGGGIACDWNFAYDCSVTPLVTIAHQDDTYAPNYLEKVLETVNTSAHPLIAFTDYGELRGAEEVYNNRLLKVKRILLSPFKVNAFRKSKFIRRRSLSFGCGICCPSVTYVKPNLPNPLFLSGYRSDVDWQAWERLSQLDGEFLYCPTPLVLHRIHVDSETSHIIADSRRTEEDFEMFCKFWPKPVAKLINKIYRTSEKSNSMS